MYKRILLAYDGSESGQKALLNCRDIAQWSHSELFLVAIMPPVMNVAVDGAFYGGESDADDSASSRSSRPGRSRPAVGSSSNSNSGRPNSARASMIR